MKNIQSAACSMVFIFLFLLSGCKDDNVTSSSTREIKFEVTGNFSGKLQTTYINKTGGGTTESISLLPWNRSIVYDNNVPSTSIIIAGTGGVSGQSITIRITSGTKQISNTSGVASASGSIAVTSPSHVF